MNLGRTISWIALAFFILGIPAGSSFGQPSAKSSCATAGKQSAEAGHNLTFAAADAEFEVVGRYDYGPAHSVHALGEILFYLKGHQLISADVSDPSAPIELARMSLNDAAGDVHGVSYPAVVQDSMMYVGVGKSLRILDVRVPAAPLEVGRGDLGLPADRIFVAGGYAYVLSSGYGIEAPPGMLIVDVHDPTAPLEVGRLFGHALSGESLCPIEFYSLAVLDTTAFLGTNAGIHVLDIRMPQNPVEIDHVPGGWVADVTLEGDLLFALGTLLTIYRVEDPAEPEQIGEVEIGSTARRFLRSGAYGYVAAGVDGLRLVDISDPGLPQLAGTIGLPGRSTALARSDTRLYVAAWEGGIQMLDVTSPDTPNVVGDIESGDAVTSVAVAGDLAIVGVSRAGVLLLDISQPDRPDRLATYDAGGYVRHVAAHGDLAIAAGEFDIDLIDLSDPMHPEQVGSVDPHGDVTDLAAAGEILYVSVGSDLRIVDISNPADSEWITSPAFCAVGDRCIERLDLDSDTQLLALAGTDGTLRLLDVSVVHEPEETGRLDLAAAIRDVVLIQDRALCLTDEALYVIDMTDPGAPRTEAALTHDVPAARNLVVAGDEAYVSSESAGLVAVDITDPAEPAIVARSSAQGQLRTAGKDSILYLSSAEGLLLLRRAGVGVSVIQDPSTPSSVLENTAPSIYPNPFSSSTTVRYGAESATAVQVDVFDVLGRRVRTLIQDGGRTGDVEWDGRDGGGRFVPTGLYFFRIRIGTSITSHSVILQR